MDDLDEQDLLDILIEKKPALHQMIFVKVFEGGDMHAENSKGEMVIVRDDGTVSTFLEGDTEWVHGETSNPRTAWEIIGFYLGTTDGHNMERVRNVGSQPH